MLSFASRCSFQNHSLNRTWKSNVVLTFNPKFHYTNVYRINLFYNVRTWISLYTFLRGNHTTAISPILSISVLGIIITIIIIVVVVVIVIIIIVITINEIIIYNICSGGRYLESEDSRRHLPLITSRLSVFSSFHARLEGHIYLTKCHFLVLGKTH